MKEATKSIMKVMILLSLLAYATAFSLTKRHPLSSSLKATTSPYSNELGVIA
jgi:hypothetical protein